MNIVILATSIIYKYATISLVHWSIRTINSHQSSILIQGSGWDTCSYSLVFTTETL